MPTHPSWCRLQQDSELSSLPFISWSIDRACRTPYPLIGTSTNAKILLGLSFETRSGIQKRRRAVRLPFQSTFNNTCMEVATVTHDILWEWALAWDIAVIKWKIFSYTYQGNIVGWLYPSSSTLCGCSCEPEPEALFLLVGVPIHT